MGLFIVIRVCNSFCTQATAAQLQEGEQGGLWADNELMMRGDLQAMAATPLSADDGADALFGDMAESDTEHLNSDYLTRSTVIDVHTPPKTADEFMDHVCVLLLPSEVVKFGPVVQKFEDQGRPTDQVEKTLNALNHICGPAAAILDEPMRRLLPELSAEKLYAAEQRKREREALRLRVLREEREALADVRGDQSGHWALLREDENVDAGLQEALEQEEVDPEHRAGVRLGEGPWSSIGDHDADDITDETEGELMPAARTEVNDEGKVTYTYLGRSSIRGLHMIPMRLQARRGPRFRLPRDAEERTHGPGSSPHWPLDEVAVPPISNAFDTTNKVFVAHLPTSATPKQLYDMFSKFGPVEGVDVCHAHADRLLAALDDAERKATATVTRQQQQQKEAAAAAGDPAPVLKPVSQSKAVRAVRDQRAEMNACSPIYGTCEGIGRLCWLARVCVRVNQTPQVG